ncbi:MAG: hypothetical protein FWF25_08240, partial [Propionibacteriaceae bacterium]|nr:hypothetical protein [Propionibacteriaceae bacterium]
SGQYLDTHLPPLEPKEPLTGFLTDKTAPCLSGRDVFKLFLQAILMDQDLRNALIQVITEQYHPQTDAAVAQLGTRLNNPDLDPFTFNLFLFSILIGYDLMRTVLAPDWETNDTDNINRITDALLHGFAR